MFGLKPKARLADGDLIEVGGAPVRLKVSARARRISLSLDPRAREVIATAPTTRRLAEALRFAEAREAWIIARLKALPAPRPFHPGATITLAGAPCRLERAAMRIKPRLIPATAEEPVRLLASGEGEAFARAVERALRAEALRVLSERTRLHVEALAQPLPQVTVADARGRWGSCKPAHRGEAARIRYNWRLVLAPPWVLDYVAAHECAHLIEANHSPAYWAVVRQIYPEFAKARAWLRRHGETLHAHGTYAF
ncbi:MAG: SprT family zinc-dependent metalloprotease [Pseudomonadota bacterium]